jgi:CheY-like chemotaxis protein
MAKTGPAGGIASKKVSLKTLRVLVVEDHADMRTGLTVLFKLLGCQARFAVDVASARAAAKEERFDVLLSDINLPDGDGWALVRELREIARRPGIAVAMSGFGGDRDISESKEAGFDVHLVKPFAPEELTKILQSVAEALAEKNARGPSSPPLKRKLAHLRSDGGPSPLVIFPFL